MRVSIGTFNLNNLFSRYNFEAEIDAVRESGTVESETLYRFGAEDIFKVRRYKGRLVKAKDPEGTRAIAERIQRMDVHVLAVQEVEDIDTLRQFNREHLNDMYPHIVLVEGNDPRLIDVGVMSMFPIGGVTSWQRATSPDAPEELVFGRDLLEVDILNVKRSAKLFTLYNTHLKSNYVEFGTDPALGREAANLRRARQAETMARIVKSRMRPDSRFIVAGDMNDAPNAVSLAAFARDAELRMVNALDRPQETRTAKPDTPPPSGPAWTHRYKSSGAPAHYELFDHIWLSPALGTRSQGAWIDRRTTHAGDGSDHDPAWVELDL
ncbi:MAG TPA: endonuclease/exonuclease/phosphatase family protein [Burkholderiales bacterium]|nr:endonuclease/exonuclease/phosphatase family protein [Burkholderiales bacterium]